MTDGMITREHELASMHETGGGISLFAGTANAPLAESIARALGVPLAPCSVTRFPDGEVDVELEASVRGRDVFLVQPTAPPVNEHLVELLVFADACRRADARRITAIVPYFGYARGDKRQGRRVPVAARAVADLMQTVGIGHVVTLDAHTAQLEGFFRIPIDNLSAVPALCVALREHLADDTVIVAPDLGGAKRASEFGERLGRPVALCVKRRADGSRVAVTQVVGDVRDRPCAIVDDMITTGSTIVECVRALRANGAREGVLVAATHGVMVPGARERLRDAGVRALIVTDSVPHAVATSPLTIQVTVAGILAQVVRRLALGESLTALAR